MSIDHKVSKLQIPFVTCANTTHGYKAGLEHLNNWSQIEGDKHGSGTSWTKEKQCELLVLVVGNRRAEE